MLRTFLYKFGCTLVLLACLLAAGCSGTPLPLSEELPLKITFDKSFGAELVYTGLFLGKTGLYSQKPEFLFYGNAARFFNELLVLHFKQSKLFQAVLSEQELPGRAEEPAQAEQATRLYLKAFTNRLVIEQQYKWGYPYRSELLLSVLLYKKEVTNEMLPVYYRTYQICRDYPPSFNHPSVLFAEEAVKLIARLLQDIARSELDNPDFVSLDETVVQL